ncbi:MAG: hypothetical protein ACFNZ2_06370 [Prevotella histicola]
MMKKDYVKPVSEVLSLYTEELMEGGFHAASNLQGTIDSGKDADDPEDSNPTAF